MTLLPPSHGIIYRREPLVQTREGVGIDFSDCVFERLAPPQKPPRPAWLQGAFDLLAEGEDTDEPNPEEQLRRPNSKQRRRMNRRQRRREYYRRLIQELD